MMHEASPVFRPPLDGFSTYEQIVVKKIQALEEKKDMKNEGDS